MWKANRTPPPETSPAEVQYATSVPATVNPRCLSTGLCDPESDQIRACPQAPTCTPGCDVSELELAHMPHQHPATAHAPPPRQPATGSTLSVHRCYSAADAVGPAKGRHVAQSLGGTERVDARSKASRGCGLSPRVQSPWFGTRRRCVSNCGRDICRCVYTVSQSSSTVTCVHRIRRIQVADTSMTGKCAELLVRASPTDYDSLLT